MEPECPICLEEITESNKVLALCSHVTKIGCMVDMIRAKEGSQIDCVMCRKPITFLILPDSRRLKRNKDQVQPT